MSIKIFQGSIMSTKGIKKFPKQETTGFCTEEIIANELQERTAFNSADIIGMLHSLSDIMAEYMMRGYKIRIGGLGTFYLSLKYIQECGNDNRFNAANIEVHTIRFLPCKNLRMHFRQAEYIRAKTTETEIPAERRRQNILNYLSTNGYITTRMAFRINQCSKSTAKSDLAALVALNKVRCVAKYVYTIIL